MPETPEQIVAAYLGRMAEIRSTGGATNETAFYGALEALLNAVGRTLKPRVIANGQLRNQGAGHPDFGLYTRNQCRGGTPMPGQGEVPKRGVVEVKGLTEPVSSTADTAQVSRYWQRYRLVLVTNYREFVLIGADPAGSGLPVRLEGFSLAASDASFWHACANPQPSVRQLAGPLIEYLRRALSHLAPLTRPADLAWLLASYARDALARVEAQASLPALVTVRAGLEQALGLRFESEKGEHFFRSTLVQTLFYGIFSAWVQWCREQPPGSTTLFNWHAAGWSLHVPMVRNLFEQVATPSTLGPLGLVELLNWTGAALNRVDRAEFFAAFDDRLAVQYFYEPFLAAFDPALRKELGVWYTPPEIVRFMVGRVDALLRSELGIEDGLADGRVIVLDPCCGTGSFIVEALDLIAERLRGQGGDALVAEDLKEAARGRIFGFEIMPAPFVVAHWQIGMLLARAGAPLTADNERAGVYLTNALTDWHPSDEPPLPYPELEAERDAAQHVKGEAPILVVIGNPPYNAFAGTSPAEEEGLVEPYKQGLQRDWGIRKFNLDDLYVRFFRIAERRIAAMTGRGIVSFISNYSWTERDSFVVMRRSMLESFDRIWVENMHGNRVITEYAPDGRTSETIFATAGFSPGIKQGITIGTLVRVSGMETCAVRYRDDLDEARAEDRRRALLASVDDPNAADHYQIATPSPDNRFTFRPLNVGGDYAAWPSLRDLAEAEPFSGLSEKRKGALIDIDRAALEARMRRYLDSGLSFDTVRSEGAGPVGRAASFNPEAARRRIVGQEPFEASRMVRYAMLPLDQRWAYHTNVQSIWNRSRPDFATQVRDSNLFIVSRMAARRVEEGLPVLPARALVNHHLLDPNAHAIPVRLYGDTSGADANLFPTRANLSAQARSWLRAIGWPEPDTDQEAGSAPWLHALAITCSPAWRLENQVAILAAWPRVPLPSDVEALRASARLGSRLADLLDPDQPVPGISTGTPSPPLSLFGVISRTGGGALSAGDLALTAGWGHGGGGRPVMPGQGRLTERSAYTAEELTELEHAAAAHGEPVDELVSRLGPPVDVWLNDLAYWSTVPRCVWELTIGGYLVLKKWLSYRELEVLGRPLTTAEAREATAIVRRLAALVIMQPELDANYRAVRNAAYAWPGPADARIDTPGQA